MFDVLTLSTHMIHIRSTSSTAHRVHPVIALWCVMATEDARAKELALRNLGKDALIAMVLATNTSSTGTGWCRLDFNT